MLNYLDFCKIKNAGDDYAEELEDRLIDTNHSLSLPILFLIAPGYISRSVAGSYDNEGIAIFALQFTYFLWVRTFDGIIHIFFVFDTVESSCARV